MKPRRQGLPSDSANLPIDVLRGRLAGLLGAPADIANLLRSPSPAEMFGEVNYEAPAQFPYTTEKFLKDLPLAPTSRVGQAAGQAASFVPLNPMPAVRGVQKVGQVVGEELAATMMGQRPNTMMSKVVPQPLFAVAPEGLLSYRGSHTAPDRDFGAPLHDLTGGGQMYPADVYSSKAAQIYGGGMPYDQKAFSIAQQFKDKPNAIVTIYRAVPKDISNSEKLATLEKQMAAYMKRGTLPKDASNYSDGSKWYDAAYDRREALRKMPDEPSNEVNKINAGDWVTLTREYAKDHGESALSGEYKIISQKVKAKDVFTNADSIHEFGYQPQMAKPSQMEAPRQEALDTAQRNAALPVEEGGLGLPKDNTPKMRAEAMGYKTPVYHGTNEDINIFNVEGKGKTSGAGAFFTTNPTAAETYVSSSGGGNILPLLLRQEDFLTANARGRNWADINTNQLGAKAGKKRYSLEDLELDRDSATSTDELGIIASNLGLKGAEIRNVKDLGPNSHVMRAKEYLSDRYGITPDETWSNVSGKQFDEAQKYMKQFYESQKGDIYAIQDPSLLRSRNAAFDPMRRNEADILAGVLPLGLLADEEQRKKLYELMPSLLGQ
jgi:hypothetical protein